MRTIELLGPEPGEAVVAELAVVLVDCVLGGASVGFLDGLDIGRAADWWRGALHGSPTLTWVAREGRGPVVGVVRLTPAPMPNGSHRADLSKLLVHSSARGRGVAGELLAHLEAEARRLGRWLLVLDTATGTVAESLYTRAGWTRIGVVPDYALTTDGRLESTTVMVKDLRG